ncbi:hypothetical protein BDN70DRAFT_157711 [Pholiota conissans]|uniref:Uncharacterized protein n=1 Tax=Pholiota conissans TaxID=109636 RepID=A0A9P6CRV4_9AGAR|nr:hypothetical protein BDN70DRAFT_157711 [Pholiota conissans]
MKKATKQMVDAVLAHQDRIQSLNISNHYDLREGLYGGSNSQALSVNMWISLSHILIESLTPVEALRVLSASPQATCVQFPLIVDLCEESALFPVVSCNRLRALEVGFDQQSTEHMYDTFFTNFMAPGLKTLICHSTDPCPVPIIDTFLRKSGAELTAIHLEHAVFERTPFSDFLKSPGIVKSLKSLSLALHPANARHEYKFHLCSTKASLETVIRLLHLNLDGQLYGKKPFKSTFMPFLERLQFSGRQFCDINRFSDLFDVHNPPEGQPPNDDEETLGLMPLRYRPLRHLKISTSTGPRPDFIETREYVATTKTSTKLHTTSVDDFGCCSDICNFNINAPQVRRFRIQNETVTVYSRMMCSQS